MCTNDNMGLYGEVRKILDSGNYIIKSAEYRHNIYSVPEISLTIEKRMPDVCCTDSNKQGMFNRVDSHAKYYTSGFNDGIDETLNALDPVKIIYNPPATIVFWGNGDKTVVKCSKNEEFNKYHGFCAAVAKRMFDNNSQVTKLVNSGLEEKPVTKNKTKKSKETKKK